MAKRKIKINILDIVFVACVFAFVAIFIISYNQKPYLGSRNMSVVIKTTSDSLNIEDMLPSVRSSDEIFYSGSKYPVKQSTYDISGSPESLYIVVEGLGDIKITIRFLLCREYTLIKKLI
jgi:hypothetical protein